MNKLAVLGDEAAGFGWAVANAWVLRAQMDTVKFRPAPAHLVLPQEFDPFLGLKEYLWLFLKSILSYGLS